MEAAAQKRDLLEDFGQGDARERAESWRYSRAALRALSQQEFAAADAQAELPAALIERFDWAPTRGRRVVVVNGEVSERHSDLADLGAWVTVGVSAGNAYSIRIDGGIDAPLHVVYVGVPSAQPSRWQASVELSLVGGHACVVEQHLAVEGATVLGSLRRRFDLAERTRLDLLSLCELPESAALYRGVEANLAADATLRATHVLLGARLQRLDLRVRLAGERARLESSGVFALRGRAHADTRLDVRHLARDTACDLVWRGVADQRGRGVFHGAITVAEGADGSDAKLSNKNLLLSPNAEIDTQPVLEIYADEVKAAHGATVGQIDERALFYLRSRGIALAEARRMMVTAFCREVLDGIADADLRDRFAAPLVSQVDGAVP